MSEELSIGETTPSMASANVKRLVIGFLPAPLAKGKEFIKAYVNFQDGELFFPVLDALVYEGDELFIGGRKIVREKGEEFWIVRRRTEEDPISFKSHNESPNVKLSTGQKRDEKP